MHSIRSDNPIDSAPLALLRTVDAMMKTFKLPYFVVGAMARDILLTHVFGLATRRATRDLDIGVAVKDWDEFEAVATKLVDEASFVRDPKIVHRLHKDETPLDIIPFHGVESSEQTITWPADLGIVMNVAGYQDAFDAALTVQIENGLNVRVVSLPGLAVLKLFAWADRGSSDSRDAVDLATLLHTYADAGNDDRLYGDEIDAMEAVEFKMKLAGARLLGRDARRVAAENTLTQMSEMLRDPQQWMRLTGDMARARSRLEDASSEAEELLKQFQEGLVGH